MYRIFFITLIVLLSFSSKASTISGFIKDKSDDKAIPYVNFYFECNNSSKQGISNASGYFESNINISDLPCTITFKMIGYNSETITVKSTTPITVYLDQSITNVKEVSVNAYSATSILNKCLEHFNQNLYSNAFNYDVFYNKTQVDASGKFNYSTEYFSTIFQRVGESPGIKNLKTRLIARDSNTEKKAIDEGLWEIRFMLSYELYTSSLKKPNISVINKISLPDVTLNFKNEIQLEKDMYYIIEYVSDTTKEDIRRGVLYINTKDYGVIYFSSNLYRNSVFKHKKEFYYNKKNGKYLLDHIQQETYNTDKSRDKIILFVDNIKFDNIIPINNGTKNVISSSLKKVKEYEADSNYWKGFNYIPRVDFK